MAAAPEPDGTDREVAEESAGEAIFEGAATGGLTGAVLGWIISVVAKRRRQGMR